MIRRAKISVLLTLVGALTASGALLNPGQRHPTYQPGAAAGFAVIKPTQATVASRPWQGTKVSRPTVRVLAAGQAEFAALTPGRAGATSVVIRKAGGAR
jgi:hypothetical protein